MYKESYCDHVEFSVELSVLKTTEPKIVVKKTFLSVCILSLCGSKASAKATNAILFKFSQYSSGNLGYNTCTSICFEIFLTNPHFGQKLNLFSSFTVFKGPWPNLRTLSQNRGWKCKLPYYNDKFGMKSM